MNIKILLITIMLLNINCSENLVNSENNAPIIFSLTAFPEVIEPADSVIIICNAMDPDGDTLVYDWITDGRVKIKGANDFDHFLYNTYENSRIVYPKNLNLLPDTLWVQCFARDVKGKSANSIVLFIVKQGN